MKKTNIGSIQEQLFQRKISKTVYIIFPSWSKKHRGKKTIQKQPEGAQNIKKDYFHVEMHSLNLKDKIERLSTRQLLNKLLTALSSH